MKLTLKDINGKDQGEVEVAFTMVEGGKGTHAVHEAVVAYRAAQRSGTASTKRMGEVATSSKKPWRQKGTGRARTSSMVGTQWRGGGVPFGPKPRDFRKKITRKSRMLALRKALSERIKDGHVMVLEDLKLEGPKTKEFLAICSRLGLKGSLLVVADANLLLATRNLPKVCLTSSQDVYTYQILASDHLLFTRAAFEKVGQRLKN